MGESDPGRCEEDGSPAYATDGSVEKKRKVKKDSEKNISPFRIEIIRYELVAEFFTV